MFKKGFEYFKTKYLSKLVIFTVLISLCIFPVASQSSQNRNFPQGSAQGTTQMNPNVRGLNIPNVDISITQPRNGQQMAFSLQVLLLLTVLSLAPSLLILMTCFLRFSIVLDFIKRALSLQQVPPTSVLNGIALFMTLFVMWPVFQQIYSNSFKPMSEGTATLEQAYSEAEKPLKMFMYSQMMNDTSYIDTFMTMAKLDTPKTLDDVPMYVMIPSYILHELTVAFKIGVILYIPFIVIDMVVASILMSMGMMMLPPVQISMPFKLMLFVLVDGWGLLTQQLFISVIK